MRIWAWMVLLSGLPAVAGAWWDGGHQVIALIAYERLSPEQRKALVRDIEGHERFAEDFAAAMPVDIREGSPSDRDQWIVAQASIWPDLARKFPPPDRERYHRSTWHYVNLPLFLDQRAKNLLQGRIPPLAVPEPGNRGSLFERDDLNGGHVSELIPLCRAALADPETTPRDRALLRCWILHLVGDIHQPLHTVAMFSERLFPEGDRGGNEVAVRPARSFDTTNLHMAWDSLLGGGETFNEVRKRKVELLANPMLAVVGERSLAQMGVLAWVEEGRLLAERWVYTEPVMEGLRKAERGEIPIPKVVLTEDYFRDAGAVARRRAIEAGYRLAELLR